MLNEYLKDKRVLLLIFVMLSLAVLDKVYGGEHVLHFGVEFIGGTQIPITLEHSVTPDQMTNLISILQQRVSTYGLKEVTIEGIGNSQIFITIPTVSPKEINQTLNLIESQGVFQGVVSGSEALNGTSILQGSIGSVPNLPSNGTITWQVNFYLTQQGQDHFSKTVFGQANKPLYLFLDRPTNTIILFNTSILRNNQNLTLSLQNEISAMQDTLLLGSKTIPIDFYNPSIDSWDTLQSFFASRAATFHKVILPKNTPDKIVAGINSLNYSVQFADALNITPKFQTSSRGSAPVVNSWSAIGLLSAPFLSPGVTNGTSGQAYQISGPVPSLPTAQQRLDFANTQSKLISSLLTGGALPVHVIVGAPTTIPPTLGTHFLVISAIAALLAVVAVAIVITVRYKSIFLIAPIMLTTLGELFIIISIIGLVGTIDLAAVAGMIAVVGTGVDAQIIITDEILHADGKDIRTRLNSAFYIIWADAALLIISMMPLLFSTSLVTIVGFSESTILGGLLGVLVTRPVYGAIVSRHFKGA